MKKIPKKLKIGGIVYTIESVPRKELFYADMAETDMCIGEITIDCSLIKISKDADINQQWVTLFHEIIHALNCKIKETETEYLAQGIYQVLSDNKLLK